VREMADGTANGLFAFSHKVCDVEGGKQVMFGHWAGARHWQPKGHNNEQLTSSVSHESIARSCYKWPSSIA
jgi:hypothetical protein